MSRENTNNKTENVLEISNLCVEYRTRDSVVKAVNGLNLTLKKGQALGVVGHFPLTLFGKGRFRRVL